jgi:hypothetical protein
MKKEVTKVDKPWGWEKWIEVNENYVVKELFMTEGNSCSLQYHEKKHGQLKFEIGPDKDNLTEMILDKGGYYTIEPFVVHRMSAVVDSLYLESSTNFLDDVIRLEDKYGRI